MVEGIVAEGVRRPRGGGGRGVGQSRGLGRRPKGYSGRRGAAVKGIGGRGVRRSRVSAAEGYGSRERAVAEG